MGDVGDDWKAINDSWKERRKRLGRNCEGCMRMYPKRTPTILLPGQRCGFCGYRDERPRG